MKQIYFNGYSEAVQYAAKNAESRGYELNSDDWFDQVNTGPGRPDEGKTTKSIIRLNRNGKPTKQSLSIQVYGMGNGRFELNYYIS